MANAISSEHGPWLLRLEKKIDDLTAAVLKQAAFEEKLKFLEFRVASAESLVNVISQLKDTLADSNLSNNLRITGIEALLKEDREGKFSQIKLVCLVTFISVALTALVTRLIQLL